MMRPAIHEDIPAIIDLVLGFFSNGELEGTGLSADPDTIEFFIQDRIELETAAVFVAECLRDATTPPCLLGLTQPLGLPVLVCCDGRHRRS